jgi:hypothetical protein
MLNPRIERRAIALFNFVDSEYHLVSALGPSLDMEVDILQRFADGTVSSLIIRVVESKRFAAPFSGFDID